MSLSLGAKLHQPRSADIIAGTFVYSTVTFDTVDTDSLGSDTWSWAKWYLFVYFDLS